MSAFEEAKLNAPSLSVSIGGVHIVDFGGDARDLYIWNAALDRAMEVGRIEHDHIATFFQGDYCEGAHDALKSYQEVIEKEKV